MVSLGSSTTTDDMWEPDGIRKVPILFRHILRCHCHHAFNAEPVKIFRVLQCIYGGTDEERGEPSQVTYWIDPRTHSNCDKTVMPGVMVFVMVEIDVSNDFQRIASEITSSDLSLNCLQDVYMMASTCTSQSWVLVISNISTDVSDCSRNLLERSFERPSHLSHRHPRCPGSEGATPRPYKRQIYPL
jgi:hypothetical protein